MLWITVWILTWHSDQKVVFPSEFLYDWLSMSLPPDLYTTHQLWLLTLQECSAPRDSNFTKTIQYIASILRLMHELSSRIDNVTENVDQDIKLYVVWMTAAYMYHSSTV